METDSVINRFFYDRDLTEKQLGYKRLEKLYLFLPCTSVSSWDGLESSCRMSWMWKLVLGILMLSNILQQQNHKEKSLENAENIHLSRQDYADRASTYFNIFLI